jgi:hypothetical protein
MGDEPMLLAFACGRCGEVRRATVLPDACFACRARIPRSPHARLQFDVGPVRANGASISLSPKVEVVFEGAWSAEMRARVEQRISRARQRDEQLAPSADADGERDDDG